MKKFFFLFIILLIANCSNTKNVYWCGDHPCINKKEKEAYFKKTMIVEIKDSKNTKHKSKSDIENILQQWEEEEDDLLFNFDAFHEKFLIEEGEIPFLQDTTATYPENTEGDIVILPQWYDDFTEEQSTIRNYIDNK